MLKVIRSIISKTAAFSSADVFEGLQQLTVLRAKVRCGAVWLPRERVGEGEGEREGEGGEAAVTVQLTGC